MSMLTVSYGGLKKRVITSRALRGVVIYDWKSYDEDCLAEFILSPLKGSQ